MRRYSIDDAIKNALADQSSLQEFNGIYLRVKPCMLPEALKAFYFARIEEIEQLYAQFCLEEQGVSAAIIDYFAEQRKLAGADEALLEEAWTGFHELVTHHQWCERKKLQGQLIAREQVVMPRVWNDDAYTFKL